jgi:N-sulfoglucosamine sulfohydrolase
MSKKSFLLIFQLVIIAISHCSVEAQERPNILWLVSEDNSPMLGAYGDELALTPNLDRLAESGVRYTNAYATSPVCSAARSTLIHGVYGIRYGIQHHRSAHKTPKSLKPYPLFFREAGYYVTNNSKKDYNLIDDQDCWDESSTGAHYKNRKPGQPFFAVFNIADSHESRLFPDDVKNKRESGIYPSVSRIDPKDIHLPAYHPDKPEIRQEWADYYDAVTHMDKQVGSLMLELEGYDLQDNTIVVYYSDHGGALARGKRSVKDSGTRIPLIIYFPDKWKHLAPVKPGEATDRFVSFVDFPATMLSLIGADVPDQMVGIPFLGDKPGPEREYVFMYRDRIDSRYDMVRAIKKGDCRYIVNYTPYRPYGQHYLYSDNSRTSTAWKNAWLAGECNEVQSEFWELKKGEELYRTDTDPDEVNSLIGNPEYQKILVELRTICHEEILRNRDVGFIPESMFSVFAGDSTIYQFAQSEAYQLEEIKSVADIAIQNDSKNLGFLKRKMKDRDPLIRYWAIVGAVILQEQASPAEKQIRNLLVDPYPEIRIAAAEAIGYLGDQDRAIEQIVQELQFDENKDAHIYTSAADVLGYLDLEKVRPLQPMLKKIEQDKRFGYGSWVARGLLRDLDGY